MTRVLNLILDVQSDYDDAVGGYQQKATVSLNDREIWSQSLAYIDDDFDDAEILFAEAFRKALDRD